MNILRLSTLSLTLTIAVFALAYANPSFAGKKCDADPNHPSCKDGGGGGGGGDDPTYSVLIDGDKLMGNSLGAFPWSGGAGGGGNKTISGRQHLAGVFTDLSFFAGLEGGPFTKERGKVCFPPGNEFPIEASVITQKRGDAEVSLWFEANTFEGGQRLFYQLHLTGDFGSDWPPVDGNSTVLTMTSWGLSATNEGNDIKAISCIGEGSIGVRIEDIQFVFITVTAL